MGLLPEGHDTSLLEDEISAEEACKHCPVVMCPQLVPFWELDTPAQQQGWVVLS